jgi:ABC-type branched-subunit amino acid transport system ATPase component
LAILKGLNQAGLTIIMIEHRLEAMFGLVSQVIALDAGEVIAAGPPAAVQADERVLTSYLGTELDADA